MAYFQCMNIGSEGASVLEDLTDVSLNGLTNGQILKYNTTTQKWENSNESGEIPDVQLFETLTYTEVKISSVVSPFTITNNTLTSVSSSMSNSETNILSTGTFDLTDINIIEVVVDSATFYQGGNWNGFFYVCDDDTNVRNNTYPSVAHKIMFSNTSTPLKYSLDVSQLNGQWFIGVCTGGHTNLVVSAVAIGSGLTGHVIIDKNNVDMSKRSGLQFTGNVTVTDDSTNDKTVVNIQGTSIDDTTASGSTTYSSNKTNTLLNGKVDKVAGKELSTNDYTDADKTKLEGIAEGAEVNVQSDWNQTNSAQDDYIKNKPSAEEQTVTDTFSTVNGGLLSECKVALSPIQDLHGYPNPWVGGAGKNKFVSAVAKTETQSGVTVSTSGDGIYHISGTASADVNISFPLKQGFTIPTSDAHTFYLKNTFDNGSVTLLLYNGVTRIDSWSCTPSDKSYSTYQTMGGQYIDTVIVQVLSGVTVNGSIAPMIIPKTESDTSYESWDNICPISGHTQVDVDVSDGQTTQEQVTVNLGGTYYSGTLDVVTGELTVDTASVDLGTLTWTYVSASARYYANVSGIKAETDSSKAMNGNCSNYKVTSLIYLASNDFCIAKDNGTNNIIFVKDSRFTDATDFKTAVSGAMLVYELATPQSIQLSPTMVKTLVGENHLSAPLDGQEITESKYRELFTWDEVESLAQRIATSAVADLRCYQFQDGAYGILAYVDSGTVFYDWVAASPSVKLLSTISVMPPLDEIEFTDSSIYSSSICELIVVGDSDVPVVTHVKVTSGKVVFTLSEALDSTIRCACKVTNSILY